VDGCMFVCGGVLPHILLPHQTACMHVSLLSLYCSFVLCVQKALQTPSHWECPALPPHVPNNLSNTIALGVPCPASLCSKQTVHTTQRCFLCCLCLSFSFINATYVRMQSTDVDPTPLKQKISLPPPSSCSCLICCNAVMLNFCATYVRMQSTDVDPTPLKQKISLPPPISCSCLFCCSASMFFVCALCVYLRCVCA